MNTVDIIKTKKIIIVLHENLPTGPGHDLRDYLLINKAKEIVYVTHPLLSLKQNYANRSRMQVYARSGVIERQSKYHLSLPMPILYFKDLFLTLVWVIGRREKYDLYVGLDPINAFAGILLKIIGLVNKTVYYTIDYVPKRFDNIVLNFVYHSLDKFCVRYSDDTWNVGGEVANAREKYYHMDRKIYSKQYHLPIGVWPGQFKSLPFEKINLNKLVYIGSLKHIMGVELMIDAMPKLVKKFPRLRLDIVGGGVDEEILKQRVRKLKAEKYIIFHGWIRDRARVGVLASDAVIGLATFNTDEFSVEVKNADPSKIKEYLSMGLPVITTNVVPYYLELEKSKCAIVISYSVDSLVDAVETLLTNKTRLQAYKANASKFAEQFDYSKLFTNALSRVL